MDLPTNCYEHLYLVPHPHLVLMTHAVKFQVSEPEPEMIPPLASPAMSLLATHPEVLSAEDRESILAVCSPQGAPRKPTQDLSRAVDQSYQQMWDELFVLTRTQEALEDNLGDFREHLTTFQTESWDCVQKLQDDMVKYLSHSSQVLQVFRDRKFEINRALSDIARFQELFMYTKNTCSKEELVCTWRHLNVLWFGLSQEIEFLGSQPPIDESLLALTERNKKVISLKRENALQDQLIARLSERLDGRGILAEEALDVLTN
eukprot:TRINITY_DN6918_c0_g1_i1.p1 TRINITY_DN6918_c0_g1~~TRINITY_DN6918_c0_g1_i1.p1  ORF type:complete len:261 (+),score=68.26 TRINITY_DN6918_c0_g1_i1:168-950(+)